MQKFKLEFSNLGGIKFLLIILIVCIHASPSVSDELSYTNSLQVYFSQIISRIAVPLYFFISGYLMEIGLKKISNWKDKIKRRTSTVLLPYFIWNGIYGLSLLGLSHVFNLSTSVTTDDTPLQVIKHIFIDPAISPLWFLRDLFMFQLTTVLLIALSNRIKIVILLLLILLWFYDFHLPYTTISSEGALFFTLGFFNWLPMFRLFKDYFKWIFIGVVILSIIDVKIRYSDFWWSLIFHRLTILIMCYSFMVLTIKPKPLKNIINKVKSISGYSFYIFVLHFPLLNILNHFLNSSNIVEYFFKIILAIVASLGIGYIINLFPKISKILTGNRI